MTLSPTERRLRAPIALLALCAQAAAQSPASPLAQPAPNRPDAARRIVRFFDFDAPDPFGLPLIWKLAQDRFPVLDGRPRPGFPIYNGAELDQAVAATGKGSMHLWTRGGSTSLRLSPGVIPVFPDTEYLISARIKTAGLEHSRACLIARYLDRANQPITNSELRSDLVVSPDPATLTNPAAAWRTVTIALPSAYTDAAYLQLDLEILQPEQFQAAELGPHQVWPQDFAGSAWFDDVAIVQLPRVEISTSSPANVIVGGAHPTINVSIRDLSGESLTGVLTLQDAAGDVVESETRPLDTGRAGWKWEPKTTRFGWYRASLDLSTKSRRVGGTYVDFAWLPSPLPAPSPSDRDEFGLIVAGLPVADRALLAPIVDAVGSGSITLPAWSADLTAENAPQFAQDLLPLINALRLHSQRISFSLPRIPAALAAAAHVERDEPASIFAADPKLWTPYLLPLIDKYGQTVQRWQIGAVGDDLALSTTAAAQIGVAQAFLAKLVPGPTLAVPWPADLIPSGSPPAASGAVLSLSYQTPDLADLLDAWRARPWPASLTVVPEPLPQQFSRHDSAAALARRAVEFWRTLTPAPGARPLSASLALQEPWTWPTPEHDQLMPTAELPVLANLVQRLDGRRIVGVLPAGAGITCYILAPNATGRTGALVAWAQAGADGQPALDAYLGDGPVTAIDIWGNRAAIRPMPALARPPELLTPGEPIASQPAGALTHHIPLSSDPTFIENVDINLARFVASFHLDPPILQSVGGDHDLAIVLTNPFTQRIDGKLSILEPGGLSSGPESRDRAWRISPRNVPFSIGPGQTVKIPIMASFSAMEEAGPKPFIAEAAIASESRYGPIRLHTNLELRLDAIELDLSSRRAPSASGPDLIVEAQATNRTSSPVTLDLSAFAAGYPRAKAAVADLAPGATITRRFFFPGAAEKLKGQRITVGAQNTDTQARINRSIPVE